MRRTPVSSSNLASVGYIRERRLLEIEFQNGHLYEYYAVPEAIYRGLLHAASPGEYFTSHIRDRYRFRQLR
ncbi:MAG: KTSC domain-containing protein [bacterium]